MHDRELPGCAPASELREGLGDGGGDRGAAASDAPLEGSYVIWRYSSVLAACTAAFVEHACRTQAVSSCG